MTALKDIINQVADEADDLLGDASSLEQAREDLQDHIRAHYPRLNATESKAAIAGVIEILKREGFFESGRSGTGFDDGEGDGFSEEE